MSLTSRWRGGAALGLLAGLLLCCAPPAAAEPKEAPAAVAEAPLIRVVLCFKDFPGLGDLAGVPSVVAAVRGINAFPTAVYCKGALINPLLMDPFKAVVKEARPDVPVEEFKDPRWSYMDLSIRVRETPVKKQTLDKLGDKIRMMRERPADVAVRVDFALFLLDPNGLGTGAARSVGGGSAESSVPGATVADEGQYERVKAYEPADVRAEALRLAFAKADLAIRKLLVDKVLVKAAVDAAGLRAVKARMRDGKAVASVELSNRLSVPVNVVLEVGVPLPSAGPNGPAFRRVAAGQFRLGPDERKTVEMELPDAEKKAALQGNLAVGAAVQLLASKAP